MLNSFMQNKLPEIKKILSQKKVIKAYVFGSACTKDFNDKSDVDFLISFQKGLDPVEIGELWWGLFFSLQEMLKRNIDLITEDSLTNPFFIEELDRTKQEIL